MAYYQEDEDKKCNAITDLPNVAPGWGCCKCNTYNGLWRETCKHCNHRRCDAHLMVRQ